jgi:hypothetical protein
MRRNTGLWTINQAAGELGLNPTNSVTSTDTQTIQLLALLNRSGNDLTLGYPWQQLREEYLFNTVNGQEAYSLPSNWLYFLDQTQWDRTNHWPLMGPKSAQEWQWLKGGLLSQGPRLRYRIWDDEFHVFPTPGASPWTLAMEYISKDWVETPGTPDTYTDSVTTDAQIPLIDCWLMVAYIKLKFYEAKGLSTDALLRDFMNVFTTLTGKEKGAPILNMAPRVRSILLGPYSIPDGNWPIP